MTDADFIAWLRSDDALRTALVEAVARIGGVETALHLSSRPYVTTGADTPAHTAYDACIVGGVSFSESLSLDGTASIGVGDIEVENRDGSRDAWLDAIWANRPVQVYMGDPRWPRADFRLIFDGVVGDLDSSGADVLNLRLLSKIDRLNVPATYATLGGSTANKDRLLPVVLGEVFNMTPLLTNPATLEYQVHAGAIEDVIEVRDNGAPRGITRTVGTGKFTLPSAVVGQITASVQGEKPGGTYSNTVSKLVQRLATAYGPPLVAYTPGGGQPPLPANRFSAGDLDAANLAAFDTAHPQPVGYCITDRTNVLVAAQELAASVGAQVVCSSVGLLRLVKLSLPAAGTPVALTAADFEAHSLAVRERTPVQAAIKLGYCKNWTVQGSGLATGLPASSAAIFAAEYQLASAADYDVASAYRLDTDPPQKNTHLLAEADATAEATRLLNLWKVPRTVFTMRCFAHLLLTELGDPVTLTHPRFGLQEGKTGQVVSVERDWLAGRVTLGVIV